MKKNSKQQQRKSQPTNQQPTASKQHTNQQPAASKQPTNQQPAASKQHTKQQPAKRPAAGKPQTPFEQQLETDRKHLRQAGEIGGVAGVDIGDKRSYVRLVGLDGELLEEVKVSTNPAAIRKYIFAPGRGCEWCSRAAGRRTGSAA